MNGLRLHLIEHRSFLVKVSEGFFSLRMVSRDNDSHVFFSSRFLTFDFCSFEVIAFLLTGFVKPKREKACPLSLLIIYRATHIEHDVRVCTEELFNNAKDSLGNLCVTRRDLLVHIRKAEPICIKICRFFLVEADQILYVVVGYKVKVITFCPHGVVRKDIDIVNIKTVHQLCEFKIEFVLFFGLSLHALFFFVHSMSPLFYFLVPSLATLEPSSDFFRSSVRKCSALSFHNDNSLIISGARAVQTECRELALCRGAARSRTLLRAKLRIISE